MPEFFNGNTHRVYVQGEDGLVKVLSGDKIKADGLLADNLTETSGVTKVGTDEQKEAAKALDVREEKLANFGPEAFPAVDPGDVKGFEKAAKDDAKESSTVTTSDLPDSAGGPEEKPKSSAKRSTRKASRSRKSS